LPVTIFCLSLFLGGCLRLYDPEASQEQNNGIIAVVEAGKEFTQSFVARRPRLNGIGLWLSLAPDSPGRQGNLAVELYRGAPTGEPLARVQLDLGTLGRGFTIAAFPPQADSAGQVYTIRLSTQDGRVQVSGRGEDVYPQGEPSLGGVRFESDAAFRLYYEYELQAFLSDLFNYASNAWLLLPIGLLLFLPGCLTLDLLGLKGEFSTAERAFIGLGLSLAAIPVVTTWTTTLGLRWNKTALWTGFGILSALAFARLWKTRPKISGNGDLLALTGILLISLVTRLIMVRDLAAPPWVDSVHHGVIARLIQESGGFPPSFAPYMEISSAQYHVGFHSVLASFQWLSGLDLPQAMLLLGQMLNALAAGATYLLALSLTRSRAAAVFAALIAGMFTPMPAYYTSWGRYTHLTGLLILPAAYVLLQRLIKHNLLRHKQTETEQVASLDQEVAALEAAAKMDAHHWWYGLLAAGVACAGLFLTHYRAAAFLVCLVLASLLVETLEHRRWKRLAQDIGLLLGVVIATLLLLLPWLPSTLSQLLLPKLLTWRGQGVTTYNTFAWNYLTAGLGKYTLGLAGFGLLWGLVRRRWFVLTLALWTGLLFALSNLNVLKLPGSGFLNNTSVQITLFLPIAIAGGFLVGDSYELLRQALPRRGQAWLPWATALAALPLIFVGARTLIPLLNPITFLARQSDLNAMERLQVAVPQGETVLVNAFSWGYGLYAGNDGGYWISALAGRQTIPPPVLYGLENDREKLRGINRLIQEEIELSAKPEELADWMRQHEIEYLYVGKKGGIFSPKALRESPFFEPLFTNDGVWLFKLRQRPD